MAGAPVTVHFTPYYCPFTRGILAGCHGFLTRRATRADVLALYEEFYRGEPFVRVLPFEKDPKASWQYLPYPSVATLAGSNFVHIGVDVDERRGRVVVFGALDNLGKGAASSAIQNMNCMLGLAEETGIARRRTAPMSGAGRAAEPRWILIVVRRGSESRPASAGRGGQDSERRGPDAVE